MFCDNQLFGLLRMQYVKIWYNISFLAVKLTLGYLLCKFNVRYVILTHSET